MKTSNFKISGEDPRAVSIARYPMFWKSSGPNLTGKENRRYYELAPSIQLLRDWKDGRLHEDEYVARYKVETLSKLDPTKVYADLGDDAILLCYEDPGIFCHRRLAAQWLEDTLGIEVPERRIEYIE